jgi:hypothetical protein
VDLDEKQKRDLRIAEITRLVSDLELNIDRITNEIDRLKNRRTEVAREHGELLKEKLALMTME